MRASHKPNRFALLAIVATLVGAVAGPAVRA
jgi:hypothetical protein